MKSPKKEVKNSPPDGYTILVGADTMVNYPIFIKDNSFVLSRDPASRPSFLTL